MVIDQFVLQDGRIFRIANTHSNLITACKNLSQPEVLASQIVSESHAGFLTTKQKNN